MGLTSDFWVAVPPLDAHEYVDNVEADDPVGESPESRDAEAEICTKIISIGVGMYPAPSRGVEVRRNLLGQWSDDNTTSFSTDEVLKLRQTALSLINDDDDTKDQLKRIFNL